MKTARRSVLLSATALSLAFAVGISGCGGGSSNNNSGGNNGGGNNGGNTSRSTVTGTVTDANGDTMVGVQVAIGNQTATTTQFGTYSIPDVTVPSGQTSLVTTVTASATINGRVYSGRNTVEVLAGQTLTNNIQVVISPANQQGSIRGTVRDDQGRVLSGARVFAAIPNPNSNLEFKTLASFSTYTDSAGTYVIPQLPAASYTVTASYAGRVNQTLQNLSVTAGSDVNASFTLAAGTGSSTPVVTTFSGYTITTPTTPTRAANVNRAAGMEAIKQWVLAQHIKRVHSAADPSKVIVKRNVSRATPAGSIIESDLFWDYTQLDNLFGYVILRSDNVDTNFRTIALLRDPLAARFADVDPALTPDLLYYYSVARLDTVNFPANGDEGNASDVISVQPLNALTLAAPASGATVNSLTPTFSWNAVNRATRYQILLYDRFPTYQSTTAADGTAPIWSPEATSPRQYDGPALVPGKTYYWAVLATDNANSAFSISPLQTFIVP